MQKYKFNGQSVLKINKWTDGGDCIISHANVGNYRVNKKLSHCPLLVEKLPYISQRSVATFLLFKL